MNSVVKMPLKSNDIVLKIVHMYNFIIVQLVDWKYLSVKLLGYNKNRKIIRINFDSNSFCDKYAIRLTRDDEPLRNKKIKVLKQKLYSGNLN